MDQIITTDNVRLVSDIMRGRMLARYEATQIMEDLVDTSTLTPGHYKLTKSLWPQLEVGPLTEGSRISAGQEFEPTLVEFTSALAGGMALMTEWAMKQSGEPAWPMAGDELGMAYRRGIETALLALAASLTTHTMLGGDTKVLAPRHVSKARTIITGDHTQEAPMSDVSGVFHPFAMESLEAYLGMPPRTNNQMVQVPEDIQREALQNRYTGMIRRVRLYEAWLMGRNATNGSDGMVFHKTAFHLLKDVSNQLYLRQDPAVAGVGWYAYMQGAYGVKVQLPERGVLVRVSAATPTI